MIYRKLNNDWDDCRSRGQSVFYNMHYSVPYQQSRQDPNSRALCTTRFVRGPGSGGEDQLRISIGAFVFAFSPLLLSLMIERREFDFGDPVEPGCYRFPPRQKSRVPGEGPMFPQRSRHIPRSVLLLVQSLQRYRHANTDVFCGWAPIMQPIDYRKTLYRTGKITRRRVGG